MGPPCVSPELFAVIIPGCRWCILDVMARLSTALPISLCVPNLSTWDAIFCSWSVAGSNSWWVPRLWYLALKSTVPSQGCWSWCPCSYTCVCHPYSGMLSLLSPGYHFCTVCGLCFPLLFPNQLYSGILTNNSGILRQGVHFSSRYKANVGNYQSVGEDSRFYIGMRIIKTKGKRSAQNIYMHEAVSGTDYVNSREMSCEMVLDPDPKGYTIVPTTWCPNQEAQFLLTVFTKASITLEPL